MTSPPDTLSPPATPRFCRRCGYNLAALPTPRCPECGRPFDPADPRTFRRRPLRRWLRHVRRAAECLLILVLLLAAVWGWFYYGWYSERQTLIHLKVNPDDPFTVRYTPILTRWPEQHLGPASFVLDRVVEVRLDGRSDLTDLAPLARLTNLRELNLNGTGVTDLAPLARLRKLELLDLGMTPVTDLAPLARLTTLQWLSVDRTGVTDLAPLAGLTDLQGLILDGTGVTDLAPLAPLTNLHWLRLEHTHVADLATLSRLKSLRGLTVPQGTISEAQIDVLRRDLPDCAIVRQ